MVPVLITMPSVNLKDFSGTWYELASIKSGAQCAAPINVTASYVYECDGRLLVENSSEDSCGKICTTTGVAVACPGDCSNAKLRVTFGECGPTGEFWIIDTDYCSYAIVGHPSRSCLWILSRKPFLEHYEYHRLLLKACGYGFDLRAITPTYQSKPGGSLHGAPLGGPRTTVIERDIIVEGSLGRPGGSLGRTPVGGPVRRPSVSGMRPAMRRGSVGPASPVGRPAPMGRPSLVDEIVAEKEAIDDVELARSLGGLGPASPRSVPRGPRGGLSAGGRPMTIQEAVASLPPL